MKLGYVCTNYNNSTFTRAAIASLHSGGRWDDVRVVVVDNRSEDEDVRALEALGQDFPGTDVVVGEANIGYFPGLNVGIKRLRDRFPEVDYMVVGNNDLTFPPDFVQSVEQHREVLDRWAVVAPDLVTPQGIHQNPHVFHPIGRVRKLVWDLYFSSYGVAGIVKRAARLARSFTVREENAAGSELYRTAGPIEQGYGACYLVGPAFFRHFSQFYAPTFMMQEEFFLFEQLKLIDQQAYYDPRFVIQHHGHATTERLPSHRQWVIGRDAHRIYKEFLGLSAEERRRRIEAQTRRAS